MTLRGRRTPRQHRGEQAEEAVARWLARRGHRVLERNFRSRFGEIDLVTLDGETLVFVEVRYRAADARVRGAQTVTQPKQLRLARAGAAFINTRRVHADTAIRFDVVGVTDGASGYQFEVIKGAFELDPESLYA